jgi:hypothetical protein
VIRVGDRDLAPPALTLSLTKQALKQARERTIHAKPSSRLYWRPSQLEILMPLGTEPTLEGFQGGAHPTLFQDLAAFGVQKAQRWL